MAGLVVGQSAGAAGALAAGALAVDVELLEEPPLSTLAPGLA